MRRVDDDFDDDQEEPDASETDGTDDDDTVPCPYCRRRIYEQAERCPHCGKYISEEDDDTPARMPLWMLIGVIACLIAVLLWAIL